MFELKALTGGYGGVTVLRDVSIAVPDGSVVALIGPNGAGKSTTLKMASGLLSPQTGTITLDGTNLTKANPSRRVRAGVCHIVEGRGVFPSLTVRENLVVFSPKGEEVKAIEQAVAAFPILGKRRHQVAGTLSGGEQQMLALARAYVSNPRVVLVDEASLGLAPLVVDTIFEFLNQLKIDGVSLLIVEQYITRVLECANYVYVLHKGEVAFEGDASEVDEDQLFALYAGEVA